MMLRTILHKDAVGVFDAECLELSPAKARDLQSTSTLEQFMTKLCLHHQRQIVDALGFLQTEVKTISSSSTSPASAFKTSCSVKHGALQGPSPEPCLEKGRTGQKLPMASNPKGLVEGGEAVGTRSSRLAAPEQTPETDVSRNVSGAAGPALDFRKSGPGESKALANLLRSTEDSESKPLSDHAPLKIKILKSSSLADGKKLSCVLTTSLPALAGTMDKQQGNSDSSIRADSYSDGPSSSVKRHNDVNHPIRQRGSFGRTRDTLVKQSPPQKTPTIIPPVSPRTARKTLKGSSYHRPRDASSLCQFVTDPDLGHCDIVYIDKPITDCFQKWQHRRFPRNNARKSTRGHMYVEEMWELKTVRTLARKSARNYSGNSLTPMPDLNTLVTPKQLLGKPESVPLVDMPFIGGILETVSQRTPSEHSAERELARDVETAAKSASEVELIVETNQTDQSLCKEQTAPPSPSQCPPVENEQSAGTDSEQPRLSVAPDSLASTVVETAHQDLNSVINDIVLSESPEQVVMGKDVNPSHKTSEEAELVQDQLQTVPEGQNVISDTQQKESESPSPSMESAGNKEENEVVNASVIGKEQAEPLEPQSPVDQKPSEGSGGEVGTEVPTESERMEVQETGKVEPDWAPGDGNNVPEEKRTDADSFSKKADEAVVKQSPPRCSEKQGIPARGIPSKVKETAVIETENMIICGYVNGRPIAQSDRCLRERPAKNTPESTPTKTKRPTKTSLKQSEKPSEKMPEIPQISCTPAELIKIPVSKHPTKTFKATQNLPDTKTPVEASQITSDARAPITARLNIPDTPPVADTPIDSTRNPEPRHPLRSARLQQREAVASPPLRVASPPLPVALSPFLSRSPPLPVARAPPPCVARAPPSMSPLPPSLLPVRLAPPPCARSAPPPCRLAHPPPLPFASSPLPSASLPLPVASPLLPVASLLLPVASPPLLVAVTFIVPPEPSTSLPLPCIKFNPPLPVASSLLRIVPSAVTQSSEELKVARAQPAPKPKPSKTQNTAVETRVQTRPKLRSSMVVVAREVEEVVSLQVSNEVSALTEGTSIKKSEAQAHSSPLRHKIILQKEGEQSKFTPSEGEPSKLTSLKNSEEPTLLKKAEAPTSMDSKIISGDFSMSPISSALDRPGRMPLRSESSKTEVASQSITPTIPPTAVENRKSALRVQRSPMSSTSVPITAEKRSGVASSMRLKSPVRLSSPIKVKVKPERIIKSPLRDSPLLVSSPLPSSLDTPLLLPKLEPLVQSRHKFLELLDIEENQQKISTLNTRFDKMHRGWVQIDKEGQPTPRHKNKADRQAAIWKSKRRVRKPKSSEHQRYSLVQMLFKNDLDLASICRWYMESTETQSMVIVKKVNTRLLSETQLLFPGMSQGLSKGVFPSLQAERLKKHLKKFAIASPVKSNPKSHKLIAKALEQEVSTSTPKGKEKRELTTATRISTKAYLSSAESQATDGQKASAKAKNPASARILRKYSNIREKMQGQQSSEKPKGAPRKVIKASKVKPSKAPKTKLTKPTKLKPATAQRQKLSVSGDKSVKEPSVVKTVRAQSSPSRKTPVKAAVQERSVKTSSSSRTVRDLSRKESASPQRSTQRAMTPKAQKNTPAPSITPKTDSNKQQVGAEKAEVEKRHSESRVSETKGPESKGVESKGSESEVESQQNMDVKTPGSPDQVLTRSQRKMEATPSPSISQSANSKPATKRSNEPAKNKTLKAATKRSQESTQNPAKRIRKK
nr:uncharacterized protein LOC115113851 [Oncorhynchus nerka]